MTKTATPFWSRVKQGAACYVGNDEVCWSGCELLRELEEEIADEFEPEVTDDDEAGVDRGGAPNG